MEFLASLAAVLVTGLFIITFVVQAFEIPSSSMEKTLLIGDHVFVNRIQFAPKHRGWDRCCPIAQVRRGDIVVFLRPAAEPGLYVVKRIIGVPGDRIHLRNGVVYRNGEALKEPYVIHSQDRAFPIPTATIFPPCRPRRDTKSIRAGSRTCLCTFRATIWWCRRGIISEWETIAM